MSPWERAIYLFVRAAAEGICDAVIEKWPDVRRAMDATAVDAPDVPQSVIDKAKEAWKKANP